MTPPPPPDGPLRPDFRADFRDALHGLAKQKKADDLRAAEDLRKQRQQRPIYKFIQVGVALIALQAAVFVYLYTRQEKISLRPDTAAPAKNCAAALNRTYWRVVAFVENQGHPPAKLDELLPDYIDKLPFDPVSGKPLGYATDGAHFTLRCPT